MQVNADKDQVIGKAVNDAALAAFPMRQTRELPVRVIEMHSRKHGAPFPQR